MNFKISIDGFRSLSRNSLIPIRNNINIFVGPNNSGKSSVLRGIALALMPEEDRIDVLTDIDYKVAGESLRVRFHFEVNDLADFFVGEIYFDQIKKFLSIVKNESGDIELPYLLSKTGKYISFDWSHLINDFMTKVDSYPDKDMNRVHAIVYNLWSAANNSSGGSMHQNWIPGLVNLFNVRSKVERKTLYLDSIRYIQLEGQVKFAAFTPVMAKSIPSSDIVHLLAALRSPRAEEAYQKKKFRKIEKFIRDILQNQSIEIDVAHDKTSINLDINGLSLPLSNLGAGIEQLLIIATFAVFFEDQIIIIDEPELHIHPILQRKLMKFLSESENRIIVATHSASIIDAIPSMLCRLQTHEGETIFNSVDLPSDRYAAIAELGYRPSDLVQTNFIFWVEGPSDRIYLKSWISSLDSSLVEGIDYIIIFYGGRLLSHLSLNDEKDSLFVHVLGVNRRCAIVMDSDRKSSDDSISETKIRIINEAKLAGAAFLLTEGREIENYISEKTFREVLSTFGCEVACYGQFEDLMVMKSGKPPNKVEFARAVVSIEPIPEQKSLKLQILDFVKRIREASFIEI